MLLSQFEQFLWNITVNRRTIIGYTIINNLNPTYNIR